jgi:solute carrier family 25 folate transporter 32
LLASQPDSPNRLFRTGAVTTILTNPIWVVKVWTFTAPPNSPAAHRGLWSAFTVLSCLSILSSFGLAGGFRAIFHDEGWRGLYRGTSLALFGVSNGALQFMGYEKDEMLGIRAEAAAGGEPLTCMDD